MQLKVFYQNKDKFLLEYILKKMNLPEDSIFIDVKSVDELLGDLQRTNSSIGIISSYCSNLFSLAKQNMLVFSEVSLNLSNSIFTRKKQKEYSKLIIPYFYSEHEFVEKLKNSYSIEFKEFINTNDLKDDCCYLLLDSEGKRLKLHRIDAKGLNLSVKEQFLLFGKSFIDLPESIADKVIVHIADNNGLNIDELINSAFENKKNVRIRTSDIAKDEIIIEGKFKGLLNLSKVEEMCHNHRILGIYKEQKEIRV